MSVSRFFRVSLLLPIALPLAALPIAIAFDEQLVGGVAWWIVAGSVVGLLPYAGVAMRLHAWSDRQPEAVVRRLGWRACALMTVDTGLLALFVTFDVWAAFFFAGIALAYSVGYIGLARLLLAALQRTGVVERAVPV